MYVVGVAEVEVTEVVEVKEVEVDTEVVEGDMDKHTAKATVVVAMVKHTTTEVAKDTIMAVAMVKQITITTDMAKATTTTTVVGMATETKTTTQAMDITMEAITKGTTKLHKTMVAIIMGDMAMQDMAEVKNMMAIPTKALELIIMAVKVEDKEVGAEVEAEVEAKEAEVKEVEVKEVEAAEEVADVEDAVQDEANKGQIQTRLT